jgi:hypothetical protein
VLAIAAPVSALKINKAQEKAWAETVLRYGDDKPAGSLDGSNANAFLHCYWNALGAKEIGAWEAKLFTDAHEYGAEGNYTWVYYARININMDLYNNSVGISLGANNKNLPDQQIAEEVQKYVNNGWLLRIKVNGVIQTSTILTDADI